MARRKKNQEAPANHERWLITYADLITLLMVFFVMLYAMSQVDVQRFDRIRIALQSQFAAPLIVNLEQESPAEGKQVRSDEADKPQTYPPVENVNPIQSSAQQQAEQELQQLYQEIQGYIQTNDLQDHVTLVDKPRGISLSLQEVLLFETGKADILQDGEKTLRDLSTLFNGMKNEISIEGNTDNVPIHTAQFPSNWELSTTRALTVLHFLQKQGVEPSRMHVIGYGEYHPVKSNSTAENRKSNRRVDIVILRDNAESQDGATAAALGQ